MYNVQCTCRHTHDQRTGTHMHTHTTDTHTHTLSLSLTHTHTYTHTHTHTLTLSHTHTLTSTLFKNPVSSCTLILCISALRSVSTQLRSRRSRSCGVCLYSVTCIGRGGAFLESLYGVFNSSKHTNTRVCMCNAGLLLYVLTFIIRNIFCITGS